MKDIAGVMDGLRGLVGDHDRVAVSMSLPRRRRWRVGQRAGVAIEVTGPPSLMVAIGSLYDAIQDAMGGVDYLYDRYESESWEWGG